jgi:hypothetical protein
VHRAGSAAVVLQGGWFRVTGALAPAAAGERVVVRVLRGGRLVRARRVAVRPGGHFTAAVRATGRAGCASASSTAGAPR